LLHSAFCYWRRASGINWVLHVKGPIASQTILLSQWLHHTFCPGGFALGSSESGFSIRTYAHTCIATSIFGVIGFCDSLCILGMSMMWDLGRHNAGKPLYYIECILRIITDLSPSRWRLGVRLQIPHHWLINTVPPTTTTSTEDLRYTFCRRFIVAFAASGEYWCKMLLDLLLY
jgi:hypothetical protein